MYKEDIRKMIIMATHHLVNNDEIFKAESRVRFNQLYISPPRLVIHRVSIPDINKHGIMCDLAEQVSTTTTKNTNESLNLRLPIVNLTNDILDNTRIINNELTVSSDVEKDQVLLELPGKVLDKTDGIAMHSRLTPGYTALILFNFGEEHDSKWIYTGDYLANSKGNIKTDDTNGNCYVGVSHSAGRLPAAAICASRKIIAGTHICVTTLPLDNLIKTVIATQSLHAAPGRERRLHIIKPVEFQENLYKIALRHNKQDGLEKAPAGDMGFGIFTTREFQKDEFIIEYSGELVSNIEGKRRHAEYPRELGSFLFELKQGYNNQWIDATIDETKLGRFINHSSQTPNSKMIARLLDNVPRAFLIATQCIPTCTQILYDYNDRDPDFPFLKQS